MRCPPATPRSAARRNGVRFRVDRHVRVLILLLLAVLHPLRLEPAPDIKRFLILHDASESVSFRAEFNSAFYDAMRAARSGPIEVFGEPIDTSRLTTAEDVTTVRNYLMAEYAGRRIDVVITVHDVATAFTRLNRDIFDYAPVVAFAAAAQLGAGEDAVTGLLTRSAVPGTLDLVSRVLPATEHVFVVDGSVENSLVASGEADSVNRANPALNVVYLRNLPMAELLDRIQAIPERSALLFVRQTIGDDARSVDQLEALAEVVRASPAPIFVTSSGLIGLGPVGGYVWQVKNDAGRLANLAMQIATGSNPRDLPRAEATLAPAFDWRQLQQWKIPASRLPVQSVVLFQSPSFFRLYRGYVAGGVVLFLAQLALILGLLIQRRHRHRAEAESLANADRYRSVVETQSELVCRFLPDSTLTFVNDAYCRFWNKTPEQLIGTKFIELVPEWSRAAVLERIGRLRTGTQSDEHETTLADGTIGWLHWINCAIVDSHGRLVELQGVGRDVTDRRRAEEALARAEARNSAVLRAIPDLMFVLLRDGTYVDYHVRDPKLLFVPPSEFIGKKVRDILTPALADMMMDALERASQRDDPVMIEYELNMPEPRFYEARIVRKSGDRLLSIVRDVTEEKRATALNRDLARRLIVSQEEERQRIARDLHDDVSQRLALLNIEVDQIAARLNGAERARLRKLSEQAGEIASDVHSLSHELHPSKLHALGLVAAVQALCRDVSKQRKLPIVFTDRAMPSSLGADVSLCLYRIVQEGLHNVARHSHAREAQVDLACDDGHIVLKIADSGVGFDPKDARYAGLGLLSMQERVAALGGQLVIHARPGGGTRIGARIPLVSAAKKPAQRLQESA